MRLAYFDCFAGASGDMIMGAMLDAGLELAALKRELSKLPLSHYDILCKTVTRNGIGGTLATVEVDEEHHGQHHRTLSDIMKIIEESELNPTIKSKSVRIFTRLAEVEAKAHRTTPDKIHFHEVGAVDSIVDVVGAVAGLWLLGIERIVCSALHVGTGTVKCAHGVLPVPAPATAELVKGVPIYSDGVQGELLTPTGAAILTTLASEFGPLPKMAIDRLGYGAGVAQRTIPNLLRVVLGDAQEAPDDYASDRVAVVETNIDDMNPQIYDYLIDKMFQIGALDVFIIPAQMKKNRPASLLTVICPVDSIPVISDLLIRETTTIGVRWRLTERIKAERAFAEVETKYGRIRVKASRKGNETTTVTPEYDDCKRIALEKNVPIKKVIEAAMIASHEIMGEDAGFGET